MTIWIIGYLIVVGGIIASGVLEKEKWYRGIGIVLLLIVVWPGVLGAFVYLVYDKIFPKE